MLINHDKVVCKEEGPPFNLHRAPHFPKATTAHKCRPSTQHNTEYLTTDSAIGLIFYKNLVCAQHYDGIRFSILAQDLLVIYLLFKPLSLKLLTPSLPTKRMFVQLKDSTLLTLSHWSFSSQSRLVLFL